MDCAIPLTTKYWEIDYGTLKSLPNSGFIENVLVDSGKAFTFYCESKNGNYCFGLRNPSKEFDYTITIFGLNSDKMPQLNSPNSVSIEILFQNKNLKRCFTNQKLKISYNFFFYDEREKMRDFIHQKYNYKNSVIPSNPIIQKPENSVEPLVNANLSIVKFQPKTTKFIDLKDVSPYKCNVFFYVNSLCTLPSTLSQSSTIITPKDMIKIAILPDGTSAAICQMEYFMESSPKIFKFDAEGLKLHEDFKSIDDHQICSSCPKTSEITSCNVWQMNANGYYLCSICCLGFGRSSSINHRCRVAGKTLKSKVIHTRKSHGYCPDCLFYFKPPVQFKSNAKDNQTQRNKHIYYTETEFFQILISNDPNFKLPCYSDWSLKKKMENFIKKNDATVENQESKTPETENESIPSTIQNAETSIKKDESNKIIDDLQEAFSDIVTIKHEQIMSKTEIIDIKTELPKTEETKLLKTDDVEKEDSENEGWEIADDENVSEEESFGNEAYIV